LSGAGPTVFAFVEPELAKAVGETIAGNIPTSRSRGDSVAHRN
jgi:argininosuccinate lyase